MAKKQKSVEVPFYKYLWNFYSANKSMIKAEYKDLTKRILSHANPDNPGAFLRKPQYEAFEIYVFLKEYLNNPRLSDLFNDWCHDEGKFCLKDTTLVSGAQDLFAEEDEHRKLSDAAVIGPAIQQLENLRQGYSNYIFSLTMGTGKTILMALCIFYEFLLAKKYPKDERFCHNVLVLAPDTTVLQSLKEIQTFDKSKIFAAEYANVLDSILKFHFLEDDGISLSTMDGSDFNVIISTSQKIILHKKHKDDSASIQLFKDNWNAAMENDPNADLYQIDETELTANQRYIKITRLKQLGIYVDEAHHAFGKSLKSDMLDRTKETSLRLTIDNLAKELERSGSKVVACYNFTGTPYVDNQIMPEVVYEYGLRNAIDNRYLKEVEVKDFKNVKSGTFIQRTIDEFVEIHRGSKKHFKRYEGMLPKMAFFANTVEELTNELKPAVEKALISNDISLDSILVNVGDEKITKSDDLREFRLLDTPTSEKQFILLVGKGKEGWNCRSLFSVALYREPKSTIFVLQATMRCLRSITDMQQRGNVFLSAENLEILQKELESNFRMSVSDLTRKNAEPAKERRIYVRKKVPVKMMEQISRFKVEPKKVGTYTIFDESFDFEKYRKTEGKHSLRNIDSATIRKEITSTVDRRFSPYSLIAELSLYLTQHEKSDVLFAPSEIRELIEKSSDGMESILEKVNYANEILYDFVIPKLFEQLYSVKYEPGEVREVVKYIVKDPPQNGAGPEAAYYTMHFSDEMFISDSSAKYCAFNQTESGNKKSFDLSGYGFDSNSEKDFFIRNLVSNNEIKHIWFTGMLTNGQSNFYVHYIDPESHSLRSYYPDFLVEDKDGKFYIVEIKGRHLMSAPSTQAKVEYAKQMAALSKMEYVFIPDDLADMILQEFVRESYISNAVSM